MATVPSTLRSASRTVTQCSADVVRASRATSRCAWTATVGAETSTIELECPIVPPFDCSEIGEGHRPLETALVIDQWSTGDASLLDLKASREYGGAASDHQRGAAMAWSTDTMERIGMPVKSR